jgi:curved DNA-binding protein CbpA
MDTDPINDPFGTLGLPRSFGVDPSQVRRAWLSASGTLHPDRAGGDPLDGAEIARRSARVNEARRVLDNPELRAEALLRLLGGPAVGADKSLPEGFLAEMMSVREELEAAADDPARVAALERWAQEQRSGHVERIGSLFDAHEKTGDRAAIASIRTELNAWRYIERMLEQIHPARGAGTR